MSRTIQFILSLSAAMLAISAVGKETTTGVQPYQLDAVVEACLIHYAEASNADFLDDFASVDTVYIIVSEQNEYVLYFTRGGVGHFGEPHPKNYKSYMRCYGSIQEKRVYALYNQVERYWIFKHGMNSKDFYSKALTETWYRREGNSFVYVASQDYEAGEYDRMLSRKHDARLEECEIRGTICGI